MPIIKKSLTSYPEADLFFKNNFAEHYRFIKDIIIIEIPEDLWTKFNLVGYGYLVKSSDLFPNYTFLEMASNNDSFFQSLPTPEHKRDVNIFRIWKKLEKPNIFIIIRPNSEFYIIHELSHVLFNENKSISPYQSLNFNDEYLDSRSEQFSHLNEIKYAQNKGVSFEDYFKNNFPDAYNLIKKYESGDKSVSQEYYQLSIMDRNDYKKMWDYISQERKI